MRNVATCSQFPLAAVYATTFESAWGGSTPPGATYEQIATFARAPSARELECAGEAVVLRTGAARTLHRDEHRVYVARIARNNRTGSCIPFSSTTLKSSKMLPAGAPDSATVSLTMTSFGRA